MVINDALVRHNVLSKLILTDGSKELPKELKVKIMRMRMLYAKIRKEFDASIKEFTETLVTDELRELDSKTSRTDEEDQRYNELKNSFNAECEEFIFQKSSEKIRDIEESFTNSEYEEIIDINSGNDVIINNQKISAPDFLEIIYELFVKD